MDQALEELALDMKEQGEGGGQALLTVQRSWEHWSSISQDDQCISLCVYTKALPVRNCYPHLADEETEPRVQEGKQDVLNVG